MKFHSEDRINSDIGYSAENVVLCRYDINVMKNNFSIEHFNFLIKNIYEYKKL